MTTYISTRALWWEAAEFCDCDDFRDYDCPHNKVAGWVFPLNRITLPNHTLLTDRYIALSIHVLAEEDDVKCLDLHLPPEQLGKITAWMTGQPLPNPSPTLFQPRLLNPIEAAGYRVRPLAGQPRIHAVVHPTAPDVPVGVLMPYTGAVGRVAL